MAAQVVYLNDIAERGLTVLPLARPLRARRAANGAVGDDSDRASDGGPGGGVRGALAAALRELQAVGRSDPS